MLLSPTAFDGFFLFLDQGPDEFFPTLRQFHAPTGRVQTLQASTIAKVSAILSFSDRIQLANGENDNVIYAIQAMTTQCPPGTVSREGNAFSGTECLACGSGYYSTGEECTACSLPACTAVGQMRIACSGNQDSYCGMCTNKPSDRFSNYTGPASSYDSGSDCPWVYLPPCPVATYRSSVTGVFEVNKTADVCVNCPPWSTTSAANSISISQCQCLGSGAFTSDKTCSVPSPFVNMPTPCPTLTPCGAVTYAGFPFPIQTRCSSSIMDTPLGVCRCQPGEFISQIYPKQCSQCPSHLYSPIGESCVRCPPFGEPSLDGSACRCVANTHDVDLTEDTIQCVCGQGYGFNVQRGCYPCGPNEYNSGDLVLSSTPWMQTKVCSACELGTWSEPGAQQCLPCPEGTFRDATVQKCTQCPTGQHATDPTTRASCTSCNAECGGRKQTKCPTDDRLFVCVDCPSVRANAAPNGLDNCATSCIEGFFEQDNECVRCTLFDQTSCPTGNRLIPCDVYSDSSCVPCVNESMPLYYAQWVSTPNGASTECAWECIQGYTARSLAWVPNGINIWMCEKESEWSINDLFTV